MTSHGRDWLLPLGLGGLALAVHLLGLDLPLAYRREAVLEGQLWLLLSSHLSHLDWPHLAMNLGGLLLIWLLWGAHLRALPGSLVCLASALAIGLGLLLTVPEVVWYIGLSGVLHGLIAAGALLALRAHPAFNIVVLTGLVAKLAWELLQTPAGGVELIPEAHLYGALGGAVAAVIILSLKRKARVAAGPNVRGKDHHD